MRFCRNGKLISRYFWPYEILHRVGEVPYVLEFPAEKAFVQLGFHFSMLKKCLGDQASILPAKGLGVNENFFYEDVPVEI